MGLHALLLALLIWHLGARPEPEPSPPPSEVALVFQSATPAAAPARAPRAPPAATPRPSPASPVEAPPARTEPAPAARPAPTPAPPQAVQPETLQPRAPAPAPALPLPALRVPLHPAPQPSAAPARPQREARAARQPAHAGRQSASRFPAPMMRSFFIPSAAMPSAAHPFSDEVMRGDSGARAGFEHETPLDLHGAERLGPDWSDEFMQWVEEHAEYPKQAIANDEDGDSVVRLVIDRYGRVTGLRLVRRSGSEWLDTGLTGLFRDAHVPPFPPGASPEDLTITFTMHYILER